MRVSAACVLVAHALAATVGPDTAINPVPAPSIEPEGADRAVHINQTGVTDDVRLLVLVISCMKHNASGHWDAIRRWKRDRDIDALIVAARPLEQGLEHQIVDDMLFVDTGKVRNETDLPPRVLAAMPAPFMRAKPTLEEIANAPPSTGDDWDRCVVRLHPCPRAHSAVDPEKCVCLWWCRLPEKIVRAFRAVAINPQLANFTHVVKVDDTDIVEGYIRVNPIWGHNTSGLVRDVAARSIASLGGRNVTYFAPYPSKSEWEIRGIYHMPSAPPTSFWYQRRYSFAPRKLKYFNGGNSYGLSRRGVELVSQMLPRESLDELYHQEIYEDVMIGRIMCCGNVSGTQVKQVELWPFLPLAYKLMKPPDGVPDLDPTPEDPKHRKGELAFLEHKHCCYTDRPRHHWSSYVLQYLNGLRDAALVSDWHRRTNASVAPHLQG